MYWRDKGRDIREKIQAAVWRMLERKQGLLAYRAPKTGSGKENQIEDQIEDQIEGQIKDKTGNKPAVKKIPVIQRRIGELDVMRVLIMSDTHGNHKYLDQALELERPYELIIHLGDIEGDEDYIEAAAGCPVEAVRGNNDYFSDLPAEQIIEVEGKRIFITHGHYYYVAAGVEHLIREARGRDVDMVMFGHIHRPLIRQEGSLSVINPGSLSYPRQEGRRPTYIVMEIDAKGEAAFFLKNL